MAQFIQDLPFTNNTIDPDETAFITTCNFDGTQGGVTFFPQNPNCTQQLADRARYIRNVNSNNLRATIFPGPYPRYTPTQLDMRRKAEILQYSQNATTVSNKQTWNRLISTRIINKRVCLTRSRIPMSSTKSDVPFPIVELSYDPDVPLYNYQPNPSSYNEFPYPDPNANPLQTTLNSNVRIPNNGENKILELTFINPSILTEIYSLTSPISVALKGTYYQFLTDTRTATAYVQTITLLIKNSGTGKLQYAFPANVSALNNMTVSFANSGEFHAILYIGAITIPNIIITQCPQYNYTFSLRVTMDTVQTDTFGNPSTTPISITEDCYANIENNSPFYRLRPTMSRPNSYRRTYRYSWGSIFYSARRIKYYLCRLTNDVINLGNSTPGMRFPYHFQ